MTVPNPSASEQQLPHHLVTWPTCSFPTPAIISKTWRSRPPNSTGTACAVSFRPHARRSRSAARPRHSAPLETRSLPLHQDPGSIQRQTWPKKINRLQIQNLFRLKFIEDHANVIFLGGVGLGKTHLSIALGPAACLKGHSVLFATAVDIINTLAAACLQSEGSKSK